MPLPPVVGSSRGIARVSGVPGGEVPRHDVGGRLVERMSMFVIARRTGVSSSKSSSSGSVAIWSMPSNSAGPSFKDCIRCRLLCKMVGRDLQSYCSCHKGKSHLSIGRLDLFVCADVNKEFQ